MSKLLAMMMKPKNYMYATIKGSLTETPAGVFSGFSNSNYLALQQPFALNANTVAEFVFKINISQISEGTSFFGTLNSRGIQIKMSSSGKLYVDIGDGTSWNIANNILETSSLSTNIDYFIKLIFNKQSVSLLISTDGVNYSGNTTTIILNQEYTYNLSYGIGRLSSCYFNGSIDLNQSYIKINNTKYQLQAVVGYKIVGNPTIVDGMVSGFSSSNRIYIANTITADANFEYNIKFKTNTFSAVQWLFGQSLTSSLWCGVYISTNGKMSIPITSIDDSNKFASLDYALQDNTIYRLNVKRIGDIVTSTIYDNIGNVIENKNYTIVGNVLFTKNNFGGNPSNYGGNFLGEIYMNETYIKINNKLWFNGQQA